MAHAEFGTRVGLSQPAISRLIGGKEASRTTYKKIFDYFKADLNSSSGDPTRKKLAMSLIQGYLRDVFDQFGLTESENEILAVNVAVVSDEQALAGSMFSGLPSQLILALYVAGLTAARDDVMKNLVMALSEVCVATPEGRKMGFPKGFFTPGGKPKESARGAGRGEFRIFGGTLGEIVSALRSADASV